MIDFSPDTPIQGYRDPSGKFFLFIACKEKHTFLGCLYWNVTAQGYAKILNYGCINLGHRPLRENSSPGVPIRAIKSIKLDKDNNEIIILKLKSNNRSIFIDTEAKKIIYSVGPWDFDTSLQPEYNTERRRKLVKLINETTILWYNDICSQNNYSFSLYVPSITLNDGSNKFRALGCIQGYPNNQNYRYSYSITGDLDINNNNELVFASSTAHALYPFNFLQSFIKKSDSIIFPGFADANRTNFIFPAYLERNSTQAHLLYFIPICYHRLNFIHSKPTSD